MNKCQLEKPKKLYSGTCGEAGQAGEKPEIFVGFSLGVTEPGDALQCENLSRKKQKGRNPLGGIPGPYPSLQNDTQFQASCGSKTKKCHSDFYNRPREMLLRSERRDDFVKARILSQWIPEWVETQVSVSNMASR